MEDSDSISISDITKKGKGVTSSKKVLDSLFENLAEHGNASVACARSGMLRATYYHYRKISDEFAEKADEAIIAGRIKNNERTLNISQEALLGRIYQGDTTAIIFALKTSDPETYDPESRIKMTHEFPTRELTEDELEQQIESIEKRKAGKALPE